MRRTRQAGFSLPELIVASAISTAIILLVASLFEAMMRSEVRTASSSRGRNTASIVAEALRGSMASVTYIQVPAAGGPNTPDLLVWQNVNPADGSKLDPSRARVFDYFCPRLLGDRTEFYLFENPNYTGGWPMPAPTCAGAPPGATTMLLASDKGWWLDTTFSRTANNQVGVSYTVRRDASPSGPAERSTRTTAYMIEGPL